MRKVIMPKKHTWRRDYNYGNRKVRLPEVSFGKCLKARICGNTNVDLGNGYCISCWDKKCGHKIII